MNTRKIVREFFGWFTGLPKWQRYAPLVAVAALWLLLVLW